MTNKEIVIKRREKLKSIIGKKAVAIIPAFRTSDKNSDIAHYADQDSDFLYLTGFPEYDALAVIAPNHKDGEYFLFCKDKNENIELWEGEIIGQEKACSVYGVDRAYSLKKQMTIIPRLLQNRNSIYYPFGRDPKIEKMIDKWLLDFKKQTKKDHITPYKLFDLDAVLHEMRVLKDSHEIHNIKKAVEITARGFRRAIKNIKPGKYEYEIAADILYEFHKKGSKEAYPTIVASGSQANTLHYKSNQEQLKTKELILIDAGAKYEGYAADISRTIPINGKFTRNQLQIYNLVLKAQLEAIAIIKPGSLISDISNTIIKVLTQGLVKLKLLQGDVNKLIKQKAYSRFYPHGFGHWLGLDVHDVGLYKIGKTWRELKKGMVLAIEPGLYIRKADDVDKKWWDIGIRIEDDVLVTEKGCEVLSKKIPKDPKQIMQLMKK